MLRLPWQRYRHHGEGAPAGAGRWRGAERRSTVGLLLVAFLALAPASAGAQAPVLGLPELLAQAAQTAGVHPDLLTAVVWVESQAWPWAINVAGAGLYPRTRAEAEAVLAQTGDDVDIGLSQISYRHWGRPLGYAKRDLLDPWTNLVLGGLILRFTMDQEAGWGGVGRYHSATPARKIPYAVGVARVYQALQARRRALGLESGPR